jgi:hypothetical protein
MDASDFAIFPASAMVTEERGVSVDVVICVSRDPNACLCIGARDPVPKPAKFGKHYCGLRHFICRLHQSDGDLPTTIFNVYTRGLP